MINNCNWASNFNRFKEVIHRTVASMTNKQYSKIMIKLVTKMNVKEYIFNKIKIIQNNYMINNNNKINPKIVIVIRKIHN